MELCSNGFHSKIAFSYYYYPNSTTNRPIHKFHYFSTSYYIPTTNISSTNSIPRTKQLNFQNDNNVPTNYSNQFPVSRNDRQSTIIQIQQSPHLASALSRYGESLKVADMNVILRYFGKLSRRRDLSQLLTGCAKIKDGFCKALELVQELQSDGLQMDGVAYGSLLSVCASHKESNEAEMYFQKMKAEGHSPNVYHYSSLLNAYSGDGNYEKAEALIEEMRLAGLELNKVIYTTLLKVYVKGGLFEKSKELLKELEALGYAEEEMPFCLIMDGLAKSGHLLEAKSVFDEMIGKKVKTDGYSYSIMISAFCRSGLLEDAKKLASEFEEKFDKYDVVILNAMLTAYCRSGEIESVMSMMKKMDDSAISPDWNTFNILIKYFCKEKLYLLAYRTMNDMHRKGHQLEEGLCSSLIYHLGKTGAHSEAFSVYNMLRYSKRTISKALHERILHILIAGRLLKDAYVVVKDNAGFISRPALRKFSVNFMRSGNVNLINDVLKAIHSSGHKIDQGLFDMAISRYIARPEKKELLLRLLEWMPGQGYVIDSLTKSLILKNSHLFGHQLIAEALAKQLVVSRRVKPHKANAR